MNRFPFRSFLIVAVFLAGVPYSSWGVQEAGLSKAAIKAGMAYMRALSLATAAYAHQDFAGALDRLDVADQIAPNIPDTWQLRGAVYAEQQAYDKAADAFEKQAQLNPGDFWPHYNLAELLLMEKKYGPAATAFQGLEIYAGHDELVKYKTVFAYLMDGKPDAAKPVLDSMKFPGDTPAYYFAHSAWEFAHQNKNEGTTWYTHALKIFGLPACLSFYDSMVQVGWLPMRNKDGSVPEPAETAGGLTLPAAAPTGLNLGGT